MIRVPDTPQQSEFVIFSGGLDLESIPVSIPPGFVSDSQNYEQDINGGYASLTGYEAFDGQAEPHLATYTKLGYSAIGTVAVGDTITGATSGATGRVIVITATLIVITKLTGTFVAENTVAGGATLTGVSAEVVSNTLNAQWLNLAADAYRENIGALPGTGPVLGLYYYKGVWYGFRNTLTTGVGMYKSTATGWAAVDFGFEVYFSAGSGTAPAEGDTITKGAVSGVLKRLCLESGTFAATTAAGRLIFNSITGGPFTAGAFTGGVTATCDSQATISIPNQNGRFKFVTANFTASQDTARVYGVDGVNRGFEFDGTTFIPINTGTTPDTPSNVVQHRNYLFFSFFGSVIYSGLGTPFNWTVIAGANEIGASDEVVGFAVQPGSSSVASMIIYCRDRTYLLYGNDPTTWELINYSESTGAIENSIQLIGRTFVVDDRGIVELQASQNYGNFVDAAISSRITSLLSEKRGLLSDTHISRDKQQYRVFFSDGSGIYCTLSKKIVAFMPVLFPDPVTCSFSSESFGGGAEIIGFGSTNGFVYKMESGTSFNGAAIEAHLDLVFNNLKSYRVMKRYRRLSFEIVSDGYAQVQIGYDLAYASSLISQPELVTQIIDSSALTTFSLFVRGNGENIAVKLLSNSDYFNPVKFSGVFIEYTPLRRVR